MRQAHWFTISLGAAQRAPGDELVPGSRGLIEISAVNEHGVFDFSVMARCSCIRVDEETGQEEYQVTWVALPEDKP
jgi:hypothetical protein